MTRSTPSPARILLQHAGILPVVTVDNLAQTRRVAEALLRGGLDTIELTLRTPVALQALAELKRALPEVVIGAGTVLSERQMLQAIDAGADFLVTPGTPALLAQQLAAAPIPAIPGAATPSELLALAQQGFDACKLFPAAALGGLAMVKALAGPLPDLALCPTGGIDEAQAADYLAQPNVACIGGSWMVARHWLAEGRWDQVEAAAARAAALLQPHRDR